MQLQTLAVVTEPLQSFAPKSFNTIKAKLSSSIPLSVPSSMNYRKYDNSYLSLHGYEQLMKIKLLVPLHAPVVLEIKLNIFAVEQKRM